MAKCLLNRRPRHGSAQEIRVPGILSDRRRTIPTLRHDQVMFRAASALFDGWASARSLQGVGKVNGKRRLYTSVGKSLSVRPGESRLRLRSDWEIFAADRSLLSK